MTVSASGKYTFFALAIVLLSAWAASATYIANFIYMHTGFDPLSFIGSGAVLGPKKIRLIEYAVYLSTFAVIAGYLYSFRYPGRLARTFVLLAVVPVLLVTTTWLKGVPLGAAQERIAVVQLPTVDYGAIFSDAAINRTTVSTYEEFVAAVNANLARHEPTLRATWGITDGDTIKVLFYLNTVANLFSYGNANPRIGGGCAAKNELFGDAVRHETDLGIRYYLDTKIGCCTDFARLLKLLFDAAGLENNLALLKSHGHIFNEVRLQGQWRALDANIGVIYDRRWNDIVSDQGPFSVTVFPVRSMRRDDPGQYRPLLWQFRHKTLMVAATGAEKIVVDNRPALPWPPRQPAQ